MGVKVSAFSRFSMAKVDFRNLTSDDAVQSETTLRVDQWMSTEILHGTGLTYNFLGALTGGTVTSYSGYSGSKKVFSFEGLNISGKTLGVVSQTPSTLDDAKLIAQGLSGDDTVLGSRYSDFLLAGDGNDLIKGNGGNDLILAGGGRDSLYGGTGSDSFAFISAKDSGPTPSKRDTIFDFSRSQGDKIDVSLIDANSLKTGNQDFAFVGTGGFHGTAGEIRYQKTASDTYVHMDLDGDWKTDISIHFDDVINFSKTDFWL